LKQAGLLKKILDSIKDLVTEANFECSPSGITLQALDSSHVALVSMLLRKEGFDKYVCNKSLTLGINLASMSKIFKCSSNDDTVTIKSSDEDTVEFIFESFNEEKLSQFELKQMRIESEALGIPDQVYQAVVTMNSSEFQKTCRDMMTVGDTVNIAATKEGVKFSVSGDLGKGSVLCRATENADKPEDGLTIQFNEAVSLSFALRYLNYFTKATALSPTVILSMAENVPLVTEYSIDELGYVRYYLAPKIDEDVA